MAATGSSHVRSSAGQLCGALRATRELDEADRAAAAAAGGGGGGADGRADAHSRRAAVRARAYEPRRNSSL